MRFFCQGAQCRIQRHHATVDKFNAPVMPGQHIQNIAVKYEDALHLFTAQNGVTQGRVVMDPQVPSEPYQSFFKFFVHSSR